MGLAITVASVAVLVYVVLLATYVLSLRVELRPGEIWLVAGPMRRRFQLIDAPMTRLHVTARRGQFGTTLGGFGIELGASVDDQGRPIEVVRLAPDPTIVIVPCQRVRLAIVPSSEKRLVTAVAAAVTVALLAESGQSA